MRKIILACHLSLDGFMAGLNDELDWVAVSEEIDKAFLPNLLERADSLLIGRVLYEGFYNYWPDAENKNPHLSKPEIEFSHWVDEAPKYVVSTKMKNAEWKNTNIINGNIAEEVERIKKLPGRDLVMFGGVKVAQSFVKLNLVDEYLLHINPVILGRGKPLFFDDVERRSKLRLIKTETFSTGSVMLNYEPYIE